MIAAEHRQAGLTVVELEGPRLDAAVAESFREDMRRIIDGGARRVALDFRNIEFMDSTGLGALVGCLKHMGEGGAIEIRRPGERVMKVLKLTRMDRVFNVRDGGAERADRRARTQQPSAEQPFRAPQGRERPAAGSSRPGFAAGPGESAE